MQKLVSILLIHASLNVRKRINDTSRIGQYFRRCTKISKFFTGSDRALRISTSEEESVDLHRRRDDQVMTYHRTVKSKPVLGVDDNNQARRVLLLSSQFDYRDP